MRIRPVALSLLLMPAAGGAQTAQGLYDRFSPAVVVVVAGAGESGGPVTVGSGAILTRTGLILTSYRQLADGDRPAARIRVFFKPARLSGALAQDLGGGQEARVLASDPDRDLALLKVPAEAINVAPLRLTRDRAAAGDRPVLVSSPEDGGPWSLATPAVLGREPDFQGLPGNHVYRLEGQPGPGGAGGILIDAKGFLLGVSRAGDPKGGPGQLASANEAVVDFLAHAREPRAAARRMAGNRLPTSGPAMPSATTPTPSGGTEADQDRKLDELDKLLPGPENRENQAPASAPAAPMAGGDPPVANVPARPAPPAGSPAEPTYLTQLRPYRASEAAALLAGAAPAPAPVPMAVPVAPTPPTPPVAMDAGTPVLAAATTYHSVEEAVFQGDFQAALDLVRSNPAGAPLVPALNQFVMAGQLAAKSQWGAARYHFGQGGASPRLARLANYWQGIMLRREGRNAAADQWFADHHLKEGERP